MARSKTASKRHAFYLVEKNKQSINEAVDVSRADTSSNFSVETDKHAENSAYQRLKTWQKRETVGKNCTKEEESNSSTEAKTHRDTHVQPTPHQAAELQKKRLRVGKTPTTVAPTRTSLQPGKVKFPINLILRQTSTGECIFVEIPTNTMIDIMVKRKRRLWIFMASLFLVKIIFTD